MKTFGFIGMGNMGYAMLKGLIKNIDKNEITFSCATQEKKDKISVETGVIAAKDNKSTANDSRFLILAVKPQMYDIVISEIADKISKEKIIISLSPAHSIDSLKQKLGNDTRIIRAMPNTPALICEAMTGVCLDESDYTVEEKALIEGFFTSFGSYRIVTEKLMNAVTCASGSSPAYVYMFIEAMADAVVKHGMPREAAYEFVAQTVVGAGKMVLATKEHPGSLKDKVCSPGGTTIEGVAALEEHGFRNSLIKAVDACFDKCNSIK